MVAFVGSFLIGILGCLAVVWYGKRRPIGAPMTWGEAIGASTFAFGLMTWCYAIVPHQWLILAEGPLAWSPAKGFLEAGEISFLGMPLPPFAINYENISHLIVVGIYGLFLTLHVVLWAIWNDRSKKSVPALPASDFGRPLVKQG